MDVAVMTPETANDHLPALVEMLIHSVRDGALVGFVWPLEALHARGFWEGTIRSTSNGERLLIGAFTDNRLVGTVQLYLKASAPR